MLSTADEDNSHACGFFFNTWISRSTKIFDVSEVQKCKLSLVVVVVVLCGQNSRQQEWLLMVLFFVFL